MISNHTSPPPGGDMHKVTAVWILYCARAVHIDPEVTRFPEVTFVVLSSPRAERNSAVKDDVA